MSTTPEWYAPPSKLPVRAIIAVLAALVVILAATLGLALAQAGPFGFSDSSRWSAVLLNDDEIFFGHLQSLNSEKLQLTDVYYVQTTKSGNTTSPSIVSLVANQLQCPKDYVWINMQSVRYWEDLQDSSFVVQQLNALGSAAKTCVKPSTSSPASLGPTPAAPAP